MTNSQFLTKMMMTTQMSPATDSTTQILSALLENMSRLRWHETATRLSVAQMNTLLTEAEATNNLSVIAIICLEAQTRQSNGQTAPEMEALLARIEAMDLQ